MYAQLSKFSFLFESTNPQIPHLNGLNIEIPPDIQKIEGHLHFILIKLCFRDITPFEFTED